MRWELSGDKMSTEFRNPFVERNQSAESVHLTISQSCSPISAYLSGVIGYNLQRWMTPLPIVNTNLYLPTPECDIGSSFILTLTVSEFLLPSNVRADFYCNTHRPFLRASDVEMGLG